MSGTQLDEHVVSVLLEELADAEPPPASSSWATTPFELSRASVTRSAHAPTAGACMHAPDSAACGAVYPETVIWRSGCGFPPPHADPRHAKGKASPSRGASSAWPNARATAAPRAPAPRRRALSASAPRARLRACGACACTGRGCEIVRLCVAPAPSRSRAARGGSPPRLARTGCAADVAQAPREVDLIGVDEEVRIQVVDLRGRLAAHEQR